MFNSVRDNLVRIAKRTRHECAIQHTPRYTYLRVDTIHNREFIVGMCVTNAKLLRDNIDCETQYDPVIIKGGLDIYGEPIPENYEQAEKRGTLHNWVYVTTPKGSYHVDVAREHPYEPIGDVFVGESVPDNYIEF